MRYLQGIVAAGGGSWMVGRGWWSVVGGGWVDERKNQDIVGLSFSARQPFPFHHALFHSSPTSLPLLFHFSSTSLSSLFLLLSRSSIIIVYTFLFLYLSLSLFFLSRLLTHSSIPVLYQCYATPFPSQETGNSSSYSY